MKQPFLVTLAVFVMTASSQAAVLWTNPITDLQASQSNPYTNGQIVAPNVIVSGIGHSAGVSFDDIAGRYNQIGWATGASHIIDFGDYITFTLTPAAGYEIDFESFVYTSVRSSAGPRAFAVLTSADNFGSFAATPDATGGTISLTREKYQNITGPIEFRIFGWDATDVTGSFGIEEFTFNGTTTAVPEPSTCALMAVAGVALFRRRLARP